MATIVPVDIESFGRLSPMVSVSVFTSPKSWSVRDWGVPDVRVTCRVDGMTELLVSVLGREEVKYPDSSLPKPIKGNYYFFFHLLNLNYVIVVYGGEGGSMFCFEFELCQWLMGGRLHVLFWIRTMSQWFMRGRLHVLLSKWTMS